MTSEAALNSGSSFFFCTPHEGPDGPCEERSTHLPKVFRDLVTHLNNHRPLGQDIKLQAQERKSESVRSEAQANLVWLELRSRTARYSRAGCDARQSPTPEQC
jgi:hypothetical protein